MLKDEAKILFFMFLEKTEGKITPFVLAKHRVSKKDITNCLDSGILIEEKDPYSGLSYYRANKEALVDR